MAQSPPQATRAYTPKHLADKILTSRSALEGERKQVTVLFADVRGSTELAGALDPEEWHTILDRLFAMLAEGVHRFEGTVNQYTGDGIMALFGAPIGHEDHAQRACYAALHLREALHTFAEELRLERGLALAVRLGLNSGEVVVGKIGDDLRMDYTAQGHVVQVAQRMEALAESGRAYLAQPTADRVAGFFELRAVGPTRIKGVPEPVRVYELLGTGEVRNRFDVARERGLSRFVGREREMAQLEAALERALRGRCQFVGIVAEAGTGKSRLVYELAERCRRRGLRVITASCPPHGKSMPMGLQMSASRSQFGVLKEDDGETARLKVRAFVDRVDPELSRDVPFLLEVLGLAEQGQSLASRDPDARLREYLRIQERLVTKMDYQLLVFEDLHWIDAASEAITVALSRVDLPNPRLKVFTYRPEHRPPEADWPEYEEIRLRPFSADATAELLRDLLGDDASVHGLERRIQERAAGNPFYVEEIVRSLVESGQLEGERGSRRLLRALDAIEVPDSVQTLLAARIDRLDERAKSVLQAAAVIGLEFPVSLIGEMTALPRSELGAALHTLARSEFAYQLAAFPEVEYAFKHPLTQQVAYETQLREVRGRSHAKAARLLERQHTDKLDEKAALIAHHLSEARETSQAARWYARSARWLESRNLAEAFRQWQLTRASLGDDLGSRDARDLALQACLQILGLGWRHGWSGAQPTPVFEEGMALARAAGDQRAQTHLLALMSNHSLMGGRVMDALDYNSRGLLSAQEYGDPDLVLQVDGNRLHTLWVAGRPREVLAIVEHAGSRPFEPGVSELRTPDGTLLGPTFKLMEGQSLICVGRLGEAYRRLEEALELSRASGEIHSQFALTWLAECCVELGDPEQALLFAQQAVAKTQEYHDTYGRIWADRFLGGALLACHRVSDACAALEGALASMRAQGTGLHGEADCLQLLAAAHVEAGEREPARARCAEAIAAAQRNGTPLFACDARLVEARIALCEEPTSSGALAEATLALSRAESLIEQTGAEGRRPRLLELRAEVARARGDESECTRLLEQGERLLVEMGAPLRARRLRERHVRSRTRG